MSQRRFLRSAVLLIVGLLLLLVACGSAQPSEAASSLPKTEDPEVRKSLLSLWEATGGPEGYWSDDNHWNTTAHYCTWRGICCCFVFPSYDVDSLSNRAHCLNDSHAVCDIRLDYQNLTGTLPEEVFSPAMQTLNNINFSNNSLYGTLPDSLWNLTSLVKLTLQNNNFSGSIPPEIYNLGKLAEFIIRGNRFSGYFPDNLSSFINLYKLDLSYNEFIGPFPILPQIGPTAPSATDFNLAFNHFEGSVVYVITIAVGCGAQAIDVAGNLISGQFPPISIADASYFRDDEKARVQNAKWYQELRGLRASSGQRVSFENVLNDILEMAPRTSIISLAGNQIVGTIPSAFFQSSFGNSLVSLSLMSNRGLTGPLPVDYLNMNNEMIRFNILGTNMSDDSASTSHYLVKSRDQISSFGNRTYGCPAIVSYNPWYQLRPGLKRSTSAILELIVDPAYYGYEGCLCRSPYTRGTPPNCHEFTDTTFSVVTYTVSTMAIVLSTLVFVAWVRRRRGAWVNDLTMWKKEEFQSLDERLHDVIDEEGKHVTGGTSLLLAADDRRKFHHVKQRRNTDSRMPDSLRSQGGSINESDETTPLLPQQSASETAVHIGEDDELDDIANDDPVMQFVHSSENCIKLDDLKLIEGGDVDDSASESPDCEDAWASIVERANQLNKCQYCTVQKRADDTGTELLAIVYPSKVVSEGRFVAFCEGILDDQDAESPVQYCGYIVHPTVRCFALLASIRIGEAHDDSLLQFIRRSHLESKLSVKNPIIADPECTNAVRFFFECVRAYCDLLVNFHSARSQLIGADIIRDPQRILVLRSQSDSSIRMYELGPSFIEAAGVETTPNNRLLQKQIQRYTLRLHQIEYVRCRRSDEINSVLRVFVGCDLLRELRKCANNGCCGPMTAVDHTVLGALHAFCALELSTQATELPIPHIISTIDGILGGIDESAVPSERDPLPANMFMMPMTPLLCANRLSQYMTSIPYGTSSLLPHSIVDIWKAIVANAGSSRSVVVPLRVVVHWFLYSSTADTGTEDPQQLLIDLLEKSPMRASNADDTTDGALHRFLRRFGSSQTRTSSQTSESRFLNRPGTIESITGEAPRSPARCPYHSSVGDKTPSTGRSGRTSGSVRPIRVLFADINPSNVLEIAEKDSVYQRAGRRGEFNYAVLELRVELSPLSSREVDCMRPTDAITLLRNEIMSVRNQRHLDRLCERVGIIDIAPVMCSGDHVRSYFAAEEQKSVPVSVLTGSSTSAMSEHPASASTGSLSSAATAATSTTTHTSTTTATHRTDASSSKDDTSMTAAPCEITETDASVHADTTSRGHESTTNSGGVSVQRPIEVTSSSSTVSTGTSSTVPVAESSTSASASTREAAMLPRVPPLMYLPNQVIIVLRSALRADSFVRDMAQSTDGEVSALIPLNTTMDLNPKWFSRRIEMPQRRHVLIFGVRQNTSSSIDLFSLCARVKAAWSDDVEVAEPVQLFLGALTGPSDNAERRFLPAHDVLPPMAGARAPASAFDPSGDGLPPITGTNTLLSTTFDLETDDGVSVIVIDAAFDVNHPFLRRGNIEYHDTYNAYSPRTDSPTCTCSSCNDCQATMCGVSRQERNIVDYSPENAGPDFNFDSRFESSCACDCHCTGTCRQCGGTSSVGNASLPAPLQTDTDHCTFMVGIYRMDLGAFDQHIHPLEGVDVNHFEGISADTHMVVVNAMQSSRVHVSSGLLSSLLAVLEFILYTPGRKFVLNCAFQIALHSHAPISAIFDELVAQENVILVAPAGNESRSTDTVVEFPTATEGACVVGGLDRGLPWRESNYGARVNFWAPATEIVSTICHYYTLLMAANGSDTHGPTVFEPEVVQNLAEFVSNIFRAQSESARQELLADGAVHRPALESAMKDLLAPLPNALNDAFAHKGTSVSVGVFAAALAREWQSDVSRTMNASNFLHHFREAHCEDKGWLDVTVSGLPVWLLKGIQCLPNIRDPRRWRFDDQVIAPRYSQELLNTGESHAAKLLI